MSTSSLYHKGNTVYHKWPTLICCVLCWRILTLPCCDFRWGPGELEPNKTTAKNAWALCHSLYDLQSLLSLQQPLSSLCITCVSCCYRNYAVDPALLQPHLLLYCNGKCAVAIVHLHLLLFLLHSVVVVNTVYVNFCFCHI
jgi:hypothetical protein